MSEDTLDYEKVVREAYPEATIIMELDMRAYNRYGVEQDGFYLGGGPSEAAAWQNAYAHLWWERRGKEIRRERSEL